MKRCPECRRDYVDDSLLYCLEDGAALIQGSVPSPEEPATAIIHDTSPFAEQSTRAQVFTTEETAVLPPGTIGTPKQNSANNRRFFAAIAIAIIALGAFGAYRYFGSSSGAQINSIAVLPFENSGGNLDTEYLSDGLAESLIYRLSQIPELKVSPRSSVFRYKGQGVDAEKIGSELGVDAVMSGRMVQRGDNLTISVDLVDVKNKKTLWGEQFERKMSDLLATQREIASAITQKLQLKLTGDEKGITKRYTDNNEAYQAYLKGRYYWNKRTTENLNKAIEQFKVAIDKDPNFALAYNGLADCYVVLPEYSGMPTSEAVPQAQANAERAIAIDDTLAEPHASLGQVYRQSWKWAESEREFKRAIELNPNYATTYHWYSHLLRALRRFDEAAVIIKRGHELDPLSSIIGVNLSEIYQLENDTNASIENSLKIIELDPKFSEAYRSLGLSYLRLGRNAEAISSLERAVEYSNRSGVTLMNLGYGYGITGNRTAADNVIGELEQKYARHESFGINIAGVYASLGEKDKAFEWLEKDFQDRNGELSIISWRVIFDSLRSDQRFKELLTKLNLPE